MLKKRLIPLLLLAAAGSAYAAVTDLGAPWERWNTLTPGVGEDNQRSIYAVWEFTNGSTSSVNPDNLPIINANPLRCPLCANVVNFPGQAVHETGDGSGQWSFPTLPGQITGQLTNLLEFSDQLTKGQVQITWGGVTRPSFNITAAFDLTLPGTGAVPPEGITNFGPVETVALGGGLNRTLYEFEITPSPNNYGFEIFAIAGTSIDSLVIDTNSYLVPEPSSLMLVGLAGLGLLRRRRA